MAVDFRIVLDEGPSTGTGATPQAGPAPQQAQASLSQQEREQVEAVRDLTQQMGTLSDRVADQTTRMVQWSPQVAPPPVRDIPPPRLPEVLPAPDEPYFIARPLDARDFPDDPEEFRRLDALEPARPTAHPPIPRAKVTTTPDAPGADGGGKGGGGGAGGGVAAAHPVAAAAMAAREQWEKTMAAIDGGIRSFGRSLADAAGNEYLGTFHKAVRASSDALEKVPVLGVALGRVGPVVEAMTGTITAFNARAQQLAGYSGPLAAAQAGNTVRNLMADLREAQVLGPSMAGLSTASNELWQEVREMLLPMKKFLIETLASVVEMTRDFIRFMTPLMQGIGAQIEKGLEQIGRMMELVAAAIDSKLMREAGEALGNWIQAQRIARIGAAQREANLPLDRFQRMLEADGPWVFGGRAGV